MKVKEVLDLYHMKYKFLKGDVVSGYLIQDMQLPLDFMIDLYDSIDFKSFVYFKSEDNYIDFNVKYLVMVYEKKK